MSQALCRINARSTGADRKLAMVRGKLPKRVLKLSVLELPQLAMNNPGMVWSDIRIMPCSKGTHFRFFDLSWVHQIAPTNPELFATFEWSTARTKTS